MTASRRVARLVLSVLLLGALAALLLDGAAPHDPPPREPEAAYAPAPGAGGPETSSAAAVAPASAPPAAASAAPDAAAPGDEFDRQLARLSEAARWEMFRVFRGRFEPFSDADPRELEWTQELIPVEIRRRLLALLDDPDPEVRSRALLALSRVALEPEEVEELARRFDREFAAARTAEDVRAAFTLAFTLAQNDSRAGVERFALALRTGEMSEVPEFRGRAALLVSLEASPAEGELLRALLAGAPEAEVRRHAAAGLARAGGAVAADALAQALAADPDPRVRARAAASLGWLGTGAGESGAPLLRALAEDGAGEVRGAAAVALARTHDAAVAPVLVEAFRRDGDARARLGAVAGVARLGESPGAPEFLEVEAAPFLRASALSDENPRLRSYAVRLLPAMPPSEENRAALRQAAAEDGNPRVRSRAAAAVAGAEGAEARAFLTERLAAEQNGRVRGAIEAALASLPPAPPR